MKGGCGVYCRRDLSMNAIAASREHPCQKPVGLMAWCMERAKVPAGATVLDPYMGSGTTGIACIRTGRKFIGIEIDADHFATARLRLEKELRQGLLPLTHNPGADLRGEKAVTNHKPGTA
jgi:site-specific DNA-methyltransferase (adenine-specific)